MDPPAPSAPEEPNRSDAATQSHTHLNKHAPANPSQLRESHLPPHTPIDELTQDEYWGYQDHPALNVPSYDSSATSSNLPTSSDIDNEEGYRSLAEANRAWNRNSLAGSEEYINASIFRQTNTSHQRHASRPDSPQPYAGSNHGESLSPEPDHWNSSPGFFGRYSKRKTTQLLAKRHGVRNPRLLYLYYYIPFLKWIQQYRWSFLAGDLIAALTMASFYIPMSLSYASNLAHVPAINGLYAFAVNPLIYALLGSCPQLIVGPEAPGSLLTGNVVRDSIERGQVSDDNKVALAQIAGVVTGVAGAVLLVAGVARVGFLDNVLSKPFLRGFISATGFVIFIDQLITQTGLTQIAKETGYNDESSLGKVVFLVRYIDRAHPLTCAVSFVAFAVIMFFRELKRWLQPRYPLVVYIPDRSALVIITTIMSWKLHWSQRGVDVLGSVKAGNAPPFSVHMPFDFGKIKDMQTVLGTSFMIAIMGFFESSVAAKSLGAPPADGIRNLSRSANRELVALGATNIIGGVFMAIPSFGGYGRSKLNAATGGRTPMSNVFLALITIVCVFVLLPAFYYIPRGVLSAMISVVAWSLIEEAPHDLRFFWRIRGWTELFLIAIVVVVTIFYSIEVGITCGIGFSLLRVISHATRPRIQILGKARDGEDQFEDAEADPDRFELIEGCLIVKIPEPLTFANTGDLKNRLDRLLEYGTNHAHPALPRVGEMHHSKNIIFDIQGVTSIDGAGTQVLYEIMQCYKENGTRIFFCRLPGPRSQVYRLLQSSGIVDMCGGPRHFVGSVKEALRLTELESLTEEFRDSPVV